MIRRTVSRLGRFSGNTAPTLSVLRGRCAIRSAWHTEGAARTRTGGRHEEAHAGTRAARRSRRSASAAWACRPSTAADRRGGGRATIQRALDLGCNFLDTSDMYGPHTNEELVGRGDRRPTRRGLPGDQVRHQAASRDGPPRRSIDGSPDYVRGACEASLRRLGVDHIDLYYQHRVDPDTPIEETVGAMAELVAAGKVRHLGLSEAGAETIRRAHAVHPITARADRVLAVDARRRGGDPARRSRSWGSALVAYSPLGRGFLSGALQLARRAR